MRGWLFIVVLAGLTACPVEPKPDGGAPYTHCLDAPGQVATPPGSELPCELLPPGFGR